MPHTPPSPGSAPVDPLQAPPHWQEIDFISDLHLQPGEQNTVAAWAHYLRHTPAQVVFILGDLFEVWVGDDAATAPDSFEQQCAGLLRQASAHCEIYFMAGNRDFLLGADFARRCGMQILQDPTVLAFAGQRWLLSHGDALCLDDTDYMRFRAQVRSTAWQQDFLNQPLAQRRAIARDLRARSEARKRTQQAFVDLDTQATLQWLAHGNATTLVHGHTHQPADHALPGKLQRLVLSDWDLDATPPRAEVLRISHEGPGATPRVRRIAITLPAR